MKIREIEIQEKSRFNSFVAQFPTGDAIQSWEWGEVKRESGGWIPVRLVGEKDSGEIVVSALMLFRKIPKTGKSIAYVPRGPVLDTKNNELVKHFTEGMVCAASKRGAILIKIDPPVSIEEDTEAANVEAAGFRPILDPTGFGGTQPKCIMQLDLDGDIDEIFARFKPKWRYNIRLAERKGVTVRTECSKEDLKLFYDVLKVTAERDRFLVRSYSYFDTIWEEMVPNGLAKLFLTSFEGRVLSGALAFAIGNRAWYVYGASSNEHRNLMPNHLMQWEMIKWAKSIGCKWYDFRGVSPRRDATVEDDRLQGLNRFKEGFSARYVEYIGEYDLVLSPVWYWLWVRVKPAAVRALKRRARSRAEDNSDA